MKCLLWFMIIVGLIYLRGGFWKKSGKCYKCSLNDEGSCKVPEKVEPEQK